MKSPGATGPAEFSVTGKRYSSGWAHSQRLKLRAKASGYCSPRQRETGIQGHVPSGTHSVCPVVGESPETMVALGRDEKVGSKDQDV